jgi:hypothetical protein
MIEGARRLASGNGGLGAEMQIFDPRLRFARELVTHWMQIRLEGLVPLEEDIDPRAIIGAWPNISIMNIAAPATATVDFMKPEARERYGRDIRKTNWFDFIPPDQKQLAEMVRGLLIGVPCGVYYAFTTSDDSNLRWDAETLALPMRANGSAGPSLSIAFTRDISLMGVIDPASGTPLKLERFAIELVDIGAGAPPLSRGEP